MLLHARMICASFGRDKVKSPGKINVCPRSIAMARLKNLCVGLTGQTFFGQLHTQGEHSLPLGRWSSLGSELLCKSLVIMTVVSIHYWENSLSQWLSEWPCRRHDIRCHFLLTEMAGFARELGAWRLWRTHQVGYSTASDEGQLLAT